MPDATTLPTCTKWSVQQRCPILARSVSRPARKRPTFPNAVIVCLRYNQPLTVPQGEELAGLTRGNGDQLAKCENRASGI